MTETRPPSALRLLLLTIFPAILIGSTAAVATLIWLAPQRAVQIGLSLERSRSDLRTERAMIDTTEPTAPQIDMVYNVRSAGSQLPIVLLHGFGGDKDNWTRYAPHLPADHPLYIPDLPGFGESSRVTEASYAVTVQAERVVAWMDQLGLKRVHLAGNSMGGQISTIIAATQPERVASLALFAPGGATNPFPPDFAARVSAGEAPLVPASTEQYRAMMELVMERRPWLPGFFVTYMAERAVARQDWLLHIWRAFRVRAVRSDDYWPRVQAPTLIVWGKQDRVLTPEAAPRWQAGIVGSELVVLDDCGHLPMVEQAAATAEAHRALITGADK